LIPTRNIYNQVFMRHPNIISGLRPLNIFSGLRPLHIFLGLLISLSATMLQAQTANPTNAASPVGNTDSVVGDNLTLPQAIAIAIKNNLVVNTADITSQTIRVQYMQAWDNLIPTLNANTNYGSNFGHSINPTTNTFVTSRNNSFSYNVNAGATIFAGLQLQNAIKAQRFNYEASRYDLQQQKEFITLNVLLDYLQVLSSRDLLGIAIGQRASDTVQLNRLVSVNNEGNLLTTTGGIEALSNLQGQVAQDEINIANAINTLETAKVNLFSLLNVPYRRDLEYQNSITATDISEYPATSDAIFRKALDIIPSIKSASLRVNEYQRLLAQTKGQYYPTLSFNANVSSNYSNQDQSSFIVDSNFIKTSNFVSVGGTNYNLNAIQYNNGFKTIPFGDQVKDNRTEFVGLTLSIPILNRLQARNNVKIARLNLRQFELNNTNTRLVLQQTIELAFQNMMDAYKNYKFYNAQATAYAEAFRITNIKFTEGVVTSDIYILAKQRSDAATTNLAAARYIYIFRTKVLDYYQGSLNLGQ
jgi:outer membrane protein